MNKRKIALLGSTGSIGTQTLDVVRASPEQFEITVLTARSNADLLIKQAYEFKPKAVVIGDKRFYRKVNESLNKIDVEVFAGNEALNDVVTANYVDVVLTALVGYAGLKPTLSAIRAKKDIALANKETLVVAGEMVTEEAKKYGVSIYPVDSEHSAIFQCLVGEKKESVEKIILTASGGPFRGKTKEQLANVSKAQALKHPNWEMGAKITIDSASLMNKGLEVIEAKWLFDVPVSAIEVVVHPQSIIHSMVQFVDGSIKAQLGLPDMKLPILYALGYPKRMNSAFKRFSFKDYPSLTFEQPDTHTFRNLALAFEAIKKSGNLPCALNAANEIAVERFLKDEISFLEIGEINASCLAKINYIASPSYEDFVETDSLTRQLAASL